MMNDHGGFNHNHHSLRIVTVLENRYPDFPGLNLSWEVLEGMVKHETDYDRSDVQDYDPEYAAHWKPRLPMLPMNWHTPATTWTTACALAKITPSQLDGIAIWRSSMKASDAVEQTRWMNFHVTRSYVV